MGVSHKIGLDDSYSSICNSSICNECGGQYPHHHDGCVTLANKDSVNNISPEQNSDRGRFIATYSGAYFYIDECNIEDIPMSDVAHALSMNCRFNGHLKKFYSVAEHSVLVSRLVDEEDALWGLLHDVTEAFVPDIPRPFKSLIHGFDEFEEVLAKKIAEHFDLCWPMPKSVKYIDTHIVGPEADVLFPNPPEWTKHYDDVCPRGLINGYSPTTAKYMFLQRLRELT